VPIVRKPYDVAGLSAALTRAMATAEASRANGKPAAPSLP
jgi:hypothetical protein